MITGVSIQNYTLSLDRFEDEYFYFISAAAQANKKSASGETTSNNRPEKWRLCMESLPDLQMIHQYRQTSNFFSRFSLKLQSILRFGLKIQLMMWLRPEHLSHMQISLKLQSIMRFSLIVQ